MDKVSNLEEATAVVVKVNIQLGDVLFVDGRVFDYTFAERLAKEAGCLIVAVHPAQGDSVAGCIAKMPFDTVRNLLADRKE